MEGKKLLLNNKCNKTTIFKAVAYFVTGASGTRRDAVGPTHLKGGVMGNLVLFFMATDINSKPLRTFVNSGINLLDRLMYC